MTDPQIDPSSSSSPAPSTSSTLVSTSPAFSAWHAVRPWLPPLTLLVKEVTSVSVTFLLSATITDLDIDIDLVEAELDDQSQLSIISEALAKGLSVKVNGSPWQRVIIRIDDSTDEAVIIIYGLMPGRQYDIDLAIPNNRHLRRQVTTEDSNSEPPSPDSPSVSAITPVINNNATSASMNSNTNPSLQPSTDAASANPPAPPPFTMEDRLSQLNSTLSLLHAERESLQSQIKTVRRDGQKADAALRSEIEALKRSSEKHSAGEARAKQKILALQEAAKRAQASTRTIEDQLTTLANDLPALVKEKEAKEKEHELVNKEAERVRKERESADERDRKRLERLRNELSALTHKLEKVTAKREKIEGTSLPEIEEQLKQTRKELESVEREEEELAIEELAGYGGIGVVSAGQVVQGFPASSTSRRRANTGGSTLSNPPGPISRPSRASDGPTTLAIPTWNLGSTLVSPIGTSFDSSPPQQRLPQATVTRQDSLPSNASGGGGGGGGGSAIYPLPPGLTGLTALSGPSQTHPQTPSHSQPLQPSQSPQRTKSYSHPPPITATTPGHPTTYSPTPSSSPTSTSSNSPTSGSGGVFSKYPLNTLPLAGRALAFGNSVSLSGSTTLQQAQAPIQRPQQHSQTLVPGENSSNAGGSLGRSSITALSSGRQGRHV